MDNITVTVVYAQSAKKQFLREILVPVNSTIAEVIAYSGVCEEYPEINLQVNKVGILNEEQTLDTWVKPNDRVEIYRPLIFDPKVARRLRAKK